METKTRSELFNEAIGGEIPFGWNLKITAASFGKSTHITYRCDENFWICAAGGLLAIRQLSSTEVERLYSDVERGVVKVELVSKNRTYPSKLIK